MAAGAKRASAIAIREHAANSTAQAQGRDEHDAQPRSVGSHAPAASQPDAVTPHDFSKPASGSSKISGYFKPSTSDRDDVDNAIAEAFIENGWSFLSVESKSFLKVVQAIQTGPKNYRPPHRRRLSGKLLDTAYDNAEANREEGIAKAVRTGGVLVSDGATVRKKPMINYLYITSGGAYYVGTEDISDDLANGDRKDAQFLFDGIDGMISKIGSKNIVCVITDGASACKGAWKLIEAKYPFIFCLWCGAHVINLFLKDVGQITGDDDLSADSEEDEDGGEDRWEPLACVADLIRGSKLINSHFNGRETARALLLVESKKHLGHELGVILPADTRFGLFFIALARLVTLRLPLKSVIHSAEYKAKSYDDRYEVAAVINDDDFWDAAVQLVDFLWPAMGLLRVADSQAPVSGRLYQMSKDVLDGMAWKIKIREAPSYADKIVAAFKKRSAQMVTDFHKAARVLNPEYKDDGCDSDPSLFEALLGVLRRMMHEEDAGKVEEKMNAILDELRIFSERQGLFKDPAIIKAGQKCRPHEWWQHYGAYNCPTLRPLAIRILAQVVGSGDAERNWKTWNFIKDNKRTRLSSERGDKLVHAHCYIRMQNREDDEQDHTKQMKEWWSANETLGIDNGKHVSKKREFMSFIEPWEMPLIDSRPQDTSAQRRLTDKYKGVYMRDSSRTDPRGDFNGEIVGVEHVKASRGYRAGWRVTVARVVKSQLGVWDQDEDDADTYDINSLLIQMIAESPLNDFLVFLGNVDAPDSGVAEAKEGED